MDLSAAASRTSPQVPTRYERNLAAFGPVAAGVIGLVEAAGRSTTDTAASFERCLMQAQHAAGQVSLSVASAARQVATQTQGALQDSGAMLAGAAATVADGMQSALGDVGVLAALATAAAGTPTLQGVA
jgi:hypothetical protein